MSLTENSSIFSCVFCLKIENRQPLTIAYKAVAFYVIYFIKIIGLLLILFKGGYSEASGENCQGV